jgi:16S rRNA (adenine1518-N6/adenine1519-N6)-dimethyltransferase
MSFRPKKSLGQNFLQNPRVIQKIIDTAGLTGKELAVEVGPGMGVLTKELVKHAKKVIAIETDRELFASLQKNFANQNNLQLVFGDALKVPPPEEPYMLVANIPYYITSPLLDHYIRDNTQNLPTRAVLLVQKEVAQKICAKPPHMNVLALHVQTFGIPKLIATVTKGNFNPTPKVDSAIIRIDFECHPEPRACPEQRRREGRHDALDYKKYFDLIHRAFSQKRKMLRATLDEDLLKKVGIDATRRPETLTIRDWTLLAKMV